MMEQFAARGVHMTLPQVDALVKRLEMGFPVLTRWQNEQIGKAERFGYVEEPFTGWRRYFYEGKVEHPKVKNWPMQAGGASIMNDMIVRLNDLVNWEDEAIVSQIHDSLCVLVPESRADQWKATLEEVMSYTLPNHDIPVKSEAKASRFWEAVK